MKKGIAMFMAAACCLSAGCGNTGHSPDQSISGLVGDEITAITVSHTVSGQTAEWKLNDDDVEAFRIWINGLTYRPEQFEAGNTPGDGDGGEVYDFFLAEGNHQEISYVINGPDDCYLLMDGEWYVVENPSDPPAAEAEAVKENAGQAEAGQENAGQENAGQENAGQAEAGEENAGQADTGQENAEQEDEWGLTLRAESVSAEGCTIVFVQHGGAPTGELSSGSWYRIEKKEGDEWVEQPYAPGIGDEIGWTSEGWTIPDEGSVSFEENWSFLYGELPPGRYRIVKEIMDWREAGDFDGKWYYAEFSL